MSYRAFLGVLTVLPFLVLAVLYTAGSAGSLEAAGQGQNPPNSPPDFGRTTITLSVTENVAAGVLGDPIARPRTPTTTLSAYSNYLTTAPRLPSKLMLRHWAAEHESAIELRSDVQTSDTSVHDDFPLPLHRSQ